MIAGETLSGDRIQELYQRIQAQNFSKGHGTSTRVDIEQAYNIICLSAQITLPLLSIKPSLSPSPSKAKPMSALVSLTA
jgi:hypothetical protein